MVWTPCLRPSLSEWPEVSWIPANFLGKFIRKSGKRDGVCVGLRGLKSRELGDEVLREKMAKEPFSMLLGLLIGTIWNYSKLLFWKSVLFHWSVSPVNKSIREFLPNISQETNVFLRAQKKNLSRNWEKRKKSVILLWELKLNDQIEQLLIRRNLLLSNWKQEQETWTHGFWG